MEKTNNPPPWCPGASSCIMGKPSIWRGEGCRNAAYCRILVEALMDAKLRRILQGEIGPSPAQEVEETTEDPLRSLLIHCKRPRNGG